MQIILGIIFHFIGGFASGSFYVPYKKVKGWHWENYWIIGGLFSWLIVPPIAAWLTIPNFTEIIKQTDAQLFGGPISGDSLGHRRINVWIRHALSWNESWQFCVAWFYIRIWRTRSIYLLQLSS